MDHIFKKLKYIFASLAAQITGNCLLATALSDYNLNRSEYSHDGFQPSSEFEGEGDNYNRVREWPFSVFFKK